MFTATFQVCVCVHCIIKNCYNLIIKIRVFYVTCSEMKFLHCAACEEYGYEAMNLEEIYNAGLLLSAFDM